MKRYRGLHFPIFRLNFNVRILLPFLIVLQIPSGFTSFCTGKNIVVQDSAARFNIATYNIFYHTVPEHPESWVQRKDHVANVIRFHDIAIAGLQEGENIQLQNLREKLGYEYVGVARDDGNTRGEYSAILYDPERFEVLRNGTFWLSETPNLPSRFWYVNFQRICTWGEFRHIESELTFYVYNVHFDHESQEARENSSLMVLEHIEKHVPEGAPVIFMGDLNAEPDNPAYKMVTKSGLFHDARDISESPPLGPVGTFNAFDITGTPDRRIDYIFLSDHFKVHRYGVITDTYIHEENGGLRFPSDHFPVLIEATLRK